MSILICSLFEDALGEMELKLMIELLKNLTNNLGYVILIAFFVSRIGLRKSEKEELRNN